MIDRHLSSLLSDSNEEDLSLKEGLSRRWIIGLGIYLVVVSGFIIYFF